MLDAAYCIPSHGYLNSAGRACVARTCARPHPLACAGSAPSEPSKRKASSPVRCLRSWRLACIRCSRVCMHKYTGACACIYGRFVSVLCAAQCCLCCLHVFVQHACSESNAYFCTRACTHVRTHALAVPAGSTRLPLSDVEEH